MTDLRLRKDFACVFTPTAVGIVLDVGHDASFHGILVDVTEEGGEIVHVVYRFAAEAFLEEMAAALVLAVVVIDVSVSDAFESLADGFFALANEQVEVIAHEAVCVVGATLSDGRAVVIVYKAHAEETVQEEEVVLLVLENHLMVDTTHHHVVDSSGGGVTGAAGHGLRFWLGSVKITE